jgi:hypothetical protein
VAGAGLQSIDSLDDQEEDHALEAGEADDHRQVRRLLEGHDHLVAEVPQAQVAVRLSERAKVEACLVLVAHGFEPELAVLVLELDKRGVDLGGVPLERRRDLVDEALKGKLAPLLL